MTGPGKRRDREPEPEPETAECPDTAATRGGTRPDIDEDLASDPSLHGCVTIEFEGVQRPSIGRIALLRQLGRGGMGVVYYGINPRLKTEVAVKILPRGAERRDRGLVDRFLREARLAARVRSEHLVTVIDVDRDRDSGVNYLVMEFVRGVSAGDWARKVRKDQGQVIAEADALDICIAASRGLAAAHLEGIVHRDVKPDNILIPADETGRPQFTRGKLADLGLARAEEGESGITRTQTTLGTPGYMAPEQITDARRAKKPADVFGMGATLYGLLAGIAPFTGSTSMEVILKTIEGGFNPLNEVRPDVSPATVALVATCLRKDPAARFPDATALSAALGLARETLGATGDAPSNATQEIERLVAQSEKGKRVATDPGPEPGAADDVLEVTVKVEDGAKTRVAAKDGGDGVRAERPAGAGAARGSPSSSATVVWSLAILVALVLGAATWLFGPWSGDRARPSPGDAGAGEPESPPPGPPPPDPAPRTPPAARRISFDPGSGGMRVRLGANELSPLSPLPDGDLEVVLERPGYAPQWVRLAASQTGTIRIEPEDWSLFQATIDLTTANLSASRGSIVARVDNVEVAGPIVPFPSAGRHTVELTLGRRIFRRDVDLLLGKPWRLPDPIPWVSTVGIVDVSEFEGSTFIAPDGRELRTNEEMAPGTYTLRVVRDGCSDGTAFIEVVAGQRAKPRIDTAPAPLVLPLAQALESLRTMEVWDALPSAQKRRAAESVGRATPAVQFAGVQDFELAGVRHAIAVFRHASSGIEMSLVPGGTLAQDDGGSVPLSPFLIARTEVTQATWRNVMRTDEPMSTFPGDDRPKDSVSWTEASGFCAAAGLSLPTDAQWEHACRAGSRGAWATGDDVAALDRVAYFGHEIDAGTAMVRGDRRCNAFGLYDVHGNVREWCLDVFGGLAGARAEAGTGLRRPAATDKRCLRGGSYCMPARPSLESSCRSSARQESRHRDVGLRPVLNLR